MGTVYSNYKIFGFPQKLADVQADRWSAPVHVRLKPTNRCNHRCWYCGYQHQNELSLGMGADPKDVIGKEKMVEICEDLSSMGVKAVTFSGGGEPLLYPHLKDAVLFLADAGLSLGLITNGSLLTGSIAETLANRLCWVRISLDGWDDESYARYRRVKPGLFSQLVDNLAHFSDIKGRTQLGVALNLDADNVHHLDHLLPLLKDCGVDSVKLAGCVVADDAATNTAYHQPFFAQTKTIIANLASRLNDQQFQIIDRYHLWTDQARTYSRCGMLPWLTVIAADLNIYTCQDKAYHSGGWLGSLKTRPFREVWFDPDLIERANALDPSRDCKHHCVAHQKNLILAEWQDLDPDHLAFV